MSSDQLSAGAVGAALLAALIFCLLPLLIGPRSALSVQISPVTSYNHPPPPPPSPQPWGPRCRALYSNVLRKHRLWVQPSAADLLGCESGRAQQLAQMFQIPAPRERWCSGRFCYLWPFQDATDISHVESCLAGASTPIKSMITCSEIPLKSDIVITQNQNMLLIPTVHIE